MNIERLHGVPRIFFLKGRNWILKVNKLNMFYFILVHIIGLTNVHFLCPAPQLPACFGFTIIACQQKWQPLLYFFARACLSECFCCHVLQQFLAYTLLHIDWCYHAIQNIQVGLNIFNKFATLHHWIFILWNDIGGASSSLRGSTSSFLMFRIIFSINHINRPLCVELFTY